ncbi:Cellulose synthase-like protein [Drosera capensis]
MMHSIPTTQATKLKHPIFQMANKEDQNRTSDLCERITVTNKLHRAFNLLILSLLFSLLAYRLVSLRSHRELTWIVALLCESCFTFAWICTTSTKWEYVEYTTHPDHLLKRVNDLPPLDIFVTTADAVLEPPILTVNTVLSLLAVDYPANKLACYVSDDACSPLIFYSLQQASKFAEQWIPFCKKYGIQVRAPFRYFSQSSSSQNETPGFLQDWRKMKDEYKELSQKIQDAAEGSYAIDLTGDFAAFNDTARNNHQPIVKIIRENKGHEEGVPHIVYIAREKRPKSPHHYKAGAMNVLTRVSGLMTNAPFMLNLDCDMFANNPRVVLEGMCLLLGSKSERDSGYIQLPQKFYDAPESDPYGNLLLVMYQHYLSRGMNSCQGPFYGGTGCFHRRKVIYGSTPEESSHFKEGLSEKQIAQRFGNSTKFCKSAAQVLSGSAYKWDHSISSSLDEANYLAGCDYENDTCWGKEVGLRYGSATEDVFTGLRIQSNGWKSIFYSPKPDGFQGSAPADGPAILTQQKRWTTGLLESLCSELSPPLGVIFGKLQLRTCLAYLWCFTWGLRSIPELFYIVLPAYCIITGSTFLPKIEEPAIFIFVALFISYNIYTLWESYQMGFSTKIWWNNQKMSRINPISSWLFGLLSLVLKLLGISQTVFEITQKDQSSSEDNGTNNQSQGRFSFDGSPIFIPGTTVVILHLLSLTMALSSLLHRKAYGVDGRGLGEILCSVLALLYLSPFLRGLFSKGKYGIPASSAFKSGLLALSFVYFCRRSGM